LLAIGSVHTRRQAGAYTGVHTPIDGTDAKTLTIERVWRDRSYRETDALNDVPPANYEVSAVAILPDGTTKIMRLYNMDDRLYTPTTTLTLKPYSNDNSVIAVPTQISFVVE